MAFDPARDVYEYDWTSQYLDVKIVKQIPEEMYKKLDGQKTRKPEGFTSGLPSKYFERWEKLMNEFF